MHRGSQHETGHFHPHGTAGPSPPPAPASIVVLAHNQLRYTRQCLDSILRHTLVPYEIIVVDNGSSDGTLDALRSFQKRWRQERQRGGADACRCRRFMIIQHDVNVGYAAGNNSGIASAEFRNIVVLNNDVVVTRGWLERLLRCKQRHPRIGVVGPMTNYASGPQVIPQVPYDRATLEGLGQFAALWGNTHPRETLRHWRVVGFCMLVDRSVIDAIGGFDLRFGLGNFDDDDFCLRAAIAGFEAVIARGCYVHHHGSRTFIGEGIDFQGLLQRNWELFKAKWELPAALPYGVACNLDGVLAQPFDPARHRAPLDWTDLAAA